MAIADPEPACSDAFAVVGQHWIRLRFYLVAIWWNKLAQVPRKQQTAWKQLSELMMVVGSSEIAIDGRREYLALTLVAVVERG